MAIAAMGPTTAPAIQALEVELGDGVVLGCEDVEAVEGEVLVAALTPLDAAGVGDEPTEGVTIDAIVAAKCEYLYLARVSETYWFAC